MLAEAGCGYYWLAVALGVYYLGWDPNLSQLFIGLFMLVAVMANNRLRQVALGRG